MPWHDIIIAQTRAVLLLGGREGRATTSDLTPTRAPSLRRFRFPRSTVLREPALLTGHVNTYMPFNRYAAPAYVSICMYVYVCGCAGRHSYRSETQTRNEETELCNIAFYAYTAHVCTCYRYQSV
jgi:hypothetical protein